MQYLESVLWRTTALIADLDVCQVNRNIFPQLRDSLAGKMAWYRNVEDNYDSFFIPR